MPVEVKICGLDSPGAVAAAVDGGARLVGFVFFPPSPRALSPGKAAQLALPVPAGILKVGVVVDADDATLDAILAGPSLDLLQLHGAETPERVTEIKARTGLGVIKALPVAAPGDLEAADAYLGVADRLMFDARPPAEADRPGGHALAFDWELIRGRSWPLPWLLAGGLEAANLAEAVRTSGARCVDVSSGVEDRPGLKSPGKITEFLDLAKTLGEG